MDDSLTSLLKNPTYAKCEIEIVFRTICSMPITKQLFTYLRRQFVIAYSKTDSGGHITNSYYRNVELLRKEGESPIRMTEVLNTENIIVGKPTYLSKSRNLNKDSELYFKTYGVSLNVKTETIPFVPEQYTLDPKSVRTIYRTSIKVNDSAVIDFSEVSSLTGITYEIEIEALKNFDTDEIVVPVMVEMFTSILGLAVCPNPNIDVLPTSEEVGRAKHLMMKAFKKTGPMKLVTISSNDLVAETFAGPDNYYVTVKKDGEHMVLISTVDGVWLCLESFCQLYYRWEDRNHTDLVVDGEVIFDSDGNIKVYCPFDCLLIKDLELRSLPFGQRLAMLRGSDYERDVLIPSVVKNDAVIKYLDDIEQSMSIKMYNSRFKVIRSTDPNVKDNFFDVMYEFLNTILPIFEETESRIPVDGIVFIPPYSYDDEALSKMGKGIKPLKWKDLKNSTIDLLVKNRTGKVQVWAYDYTTLKEYTDYPINAKNAVMDLIKLEFDDIIVEFELVNGILEPRKTRDRKISPNSLTIIRGNLHNNIKKEDLMGQTLFFHRKNLNRIKRNLLSVKRDGSIKILLDIGSGRLGDLNKWQSYDLVLAVEPLEENRIEALKRLSGSDREGSVFLCPLGGEDTTLIYQSLMFLCGSKADTISIMLSMTYLWEPIKFKSLMNTISLCLKPGGTVVFLTINGTAVNKLLENLDIYTCPLYTIEVRDKETYSFSITDQSHDTLVEKDGQIEHYVNLLDVTIAHDLKLIAVTAQPLMSQYEATLSSLYSYGKFKVLDKNLIDITMANVCSFREWTFIQPKESKRAIDCYFHAFTRNIINKEREILDILKSNLVVRDDGSIINYFKLATICGVSIILCSRDEKCSFRILYETPRKKYCVVLFVEGRGVHMGQRLRNGIKETYFGLDFSF